MSTLQPGDQAPEVALPDEHGTIHRLSDRAGQWTVVYFYPKDDTPGCATEACEMRDVNDRVKAIGAEIWGISRDSSASHAAFRAKYDLPFTLLSDEDHAVTEAWGSWQLKVQNGQESMGVVRSTFLVGPDGGIAKTWPKVSPEGHGADVIAALEAVRTA
jgi:thioredoxin-dependent peroxiredoxin